MNLVKFDREEKYIKDFVKLAERLYDSSDNMEDPDSIKKILKGEHPLSKYFSLAKFLVYDDEGNVKGRFCITSYEGDKTAYLGFFECVNDADAAKFLFDSAYEYCSENGFEKIQGPVDASFWIKYRLKINRFETPYTGEPYNKDYYLNLFEDNGFEVCEHYTSHSFRSVGEEYKNPKFEEHYQEFLNAGYEIRSPKEEEFSDCIDDVYRLVTDLYSDFPIFKDVERENFREVFMSYKQIMNMSMTKLAYYNGKAVGFYVSVPDYGNLVYHTGNPVNIAKILMTKKKPKRYVMLYMGVDQQHRGLGKALVYAIMKELMASGLPSIGALMRDGKLTQTYANGDITGVYEYVLLERKIEMNELEKFLRADYEKWKDNDYLHEMVDGKYVGITMGEFIEKVNYLGTYLVNNGYKGKNIGIYSPNSIAWMIADVAIMNYVGLSIGLNKDWKDDNLDYAIGKCEISLMLYSKSLEDKINVVKDKYPDVEFVSIEENFDRMLEEGKAACKELFALEPVDEDKPAKIVFTSGSTSFPKAVMLSIKNIYSSYEALGRRIQVDTNDVCYLFLPLNHTYGSIFNFLYSLVFGYSIYLTGDIKNMAQEMMMVHPTVFCAVPLVCVKFCEGAKAMNVPLKMLLGGRMRYLFIGGSCLPYDIRQAFIDQGINPMNAYALSETSSGFSIDYPDVTDMDSAGTLLEYVDAKVIDPDEDGIGELAIKGPNVFHGYLNDPEATARAFNEDGYFLTGDLGKIVGNMVYVKGRKDTMLVLLNGENVSSKRIADKVKEADPRIASVKAYIRDDLLTCDIFVKDKSFIEGDWQAVIDKVNEDLSKYEKIRKFSVVDIGALLKG